MNVTSVENNLGIINRSVNSSKDNTGKAVFSTLNENSKFENPNIVSMDSFTKDISLEEYKQLVKKSTNDEGNTIEDSKAIFKFMKTEVYAEYQKSEQLKKGSDKDIETIISINDDDITFGYNGFSKAPNKYASYIVPMDPQKTIDNLYEAFGKNNVSVDVFDQGKGPTNAEYFEKATGKNHFRFVMSDGKFG